MNYGEKISKEMQVRFNLTNEATERMGKDIDKAIADGIKLDAWLRLPPEKRKRPETSIMQKAAASPKTPEKELEILRREINKIKEDDYEGRQYSNEIKVKIQRIKDLEFQLKNQ